MNDNNNRHSAYRDLEAEERKKLFEEHIAGLKAKMQKKVSKQALLSPRVARFACLVFVY